MTATGAHGEWVVPEFHFVDVLKLCTIWYVLFVFFVRNLDLLLLLGLDRHVPQFSFKLFHVVVLLFLLLLHIGELTRAVRGRFTLTLL